LLLNRSEFLGVLSIIFGFNIVEISGRLKYHDFTGNVRELQNVVERAVILRNPDGVISLEQLNLTGKLAGPSTVSGGKPTRSRKEEPFQKLEDAEKDHIIKALAEAGHNRSKTAKLLGVNIRTLRNKTAAYKKEPRPTRSWVNSGLILSGNRLGPLKKPLLFSLPFAGKRVHFRQIKGFVNDLFTRHPVFAMCPVLTRCDMRHSSISVPSGQAVGQGQYGQGC